ncbi:MAG: ABC transporter permease subunit, partial [Clostridia bacterium]|nr:ABC transporter permease subunit [Clostridia bacterium]
FAFVMIGPKYWVLDLSEQDATLTNLPPSNNMMTVPEQMLKNGIADIAAGNTYGIGTDVNGELYIWGHTRITEKIDIANVPDEVRAADLSMIAAGTDHVVALAEDGQVYVWGNTRLKQDKFGNDMEKAMKKGGKDWEVIQLEASNQFSAIVTADGNCYLWGNGNMADVKIKSKFQGKVAKVALTENEYIALMTDGSVAYTGNKDKNSPFARIPDEVKGKNSAVDVASTSKSVAALTKDGQVVVWGSASKGENKVPEFGSKVVKLYGGRYHYTALLEDGSVVTWGDNKYKQLDMPEELASVKIDRMFVSNYQNYALDTEGKLHTWGLKGFALGTDTLGRDMLTRIVNGGKVTMTVGAISVIIATILGIILGGTAGYFGGKLDMLIMRVAEIVGGLPFIPFAMILSAVIGTRLDPTQRMYLIMVVLGVLSWVPTCRLVRSQILAQREMEYVTAAKAMGIKESTIVFRHILPNVFSLLIVSMTLDFATCMLTESTLSYLGFGIPLPTPTWGNLLNGANNSIVIQQYWWQWVFPATIFGICTICINLIGDGLRDALDPKTIGR